MSEELDRAIRKIREQEAEIESLRVRLAATTTEKFRLLKALDALEEIRDLMKKEDKHGV